MPEGTIAACGISFEQGGPPQCVECCGREECEVEDGQVGLDEDGEPDFTVDPNDPTHPGWES